MKVIGDLHLGPFCPFRGTRIKHIGHRILGGVQLVIVLVVLGFLVWMLLEEFLAPQQWSTKLAFTWKWLRAGVVELITCVVLASVWKALRHDRFRAIVRILATTMFIGLVLVPSIDWPRIQLRLPEVLQPHCTLSLARQVALVAVVIGVSDLLWTLYSALGAFRNRCAPNFAPFDRITGRRKRAAKQVPGPIGFLFVVDDAYLTDKVIAMQLDRAGSSIELCPAHGPPSALNDDGNLQLSHLNRSFRVWLGNSGWERSRMDSGTGKSLLAAWLVDTFETDAGAGKTTIQQAGNWPVIHLGEEESHLFCNRHRSESTRPKALGVFLFFLFEDELSDIDDSKVYPVFRRGGQVTCTLPFESQMNFDEGRTTPSFTCTDESVTPQGWSSVFLTESIVLPLAYRKEQYYLIYSPFGPI